MDGKHTPGPWKAENGTGSGGKGWGCWEVFACDGPETYIAGSNRDNPDQEANARLIAAAPELLEALQTALRDSGCDGDLCAHWWHEKARAAIAKAQP